MEDHPPFGQWLRRRRKSLDLSQLDLAERANCSPDTIQKIEAGTRRPSRQVAGLLAQALQIAPGEQGAFVRFARGQEPEEPAGLPAGSEPERAPTELRPLLPRLPLQLTTLIGREREVAQLGELLPRPDVRLLTLIGPPGIGKTRLCVEVTANYARRFAGGACFVPLAAVEDPELVVSSIGEALGLKPGIQQPLERLERLLRDRQFLLVLDNFEQVLDAAPAMMELLGACPQLTLLVTSREALHVPGERQYPVPLLAAPELDNRRSMPAAHAQSFHAVQLFAERSTAVQPGFRVTDANAAAIAGICARLDGLPLAIELAAARGRLLAPHEILARLDGSLALLSGGSQYLPPRQRTLRGAIEWSYRLLGAQEQQLFNRLGVFAGGCTLEAAAAVALPERQTGAGTAASTDVDALDALASLVDKSLLRQEAGLEEASRFVMLETMREYAVERLRENGKLRAVRLAHGGYFLALVETAMPQLLGSEQAGWLRRLEREHDNIRTALGWLSGGGTEDIEMALRICCFAALFWDIHGHFYEGRRWLSICLERAEQQIANAAPGTPETISTAILARAYKAAGNLANKQGDAATSRQYQLLSLELYRQIGDRRGEASACMNLGNAAFTHSDYVAARAWSEQALEIFRELADTAHTAMVLNNLGNTLRCLGDHEQARALQEESLQLHRQRGDMHDVAMVLSNLGWGAHYTGDLGAARVLLEEGLAIARQLDYKYGMAVMLSTLGCVAIEQRAYSAAGSLLDQAHALQQHLGDDYGMAYYLWGLGALAQAQRDYTAAREHFRASLQHYLTIGNRLGAGGCIERLAQVEAVLGQATQAAQLLGAVAQWRSDLSTPLAPVEHQHHDRALAAVREQLGGAAFERALAEGRALAPEAAVAIASNRPRMGHE